MTSVDTQKRGGKERTVICQHCNNEFTQWMSRPAPLCPDCRELFLNPPQQKDEGHCRVCQCELAEQRPDGRPGRQATFCSPCYDQHRKVASQEAKRKARAANG